MVHTGEPLKIVALLFYADGVTCQDYCGFVRSLSKKYRDNPASYKRLHQTADSGSSALPRCWRLRTCSQCVMNRPAGGRFRWFIRLAAWRNFSRYLRPLDPHCRAMACAPSSRLHGPIPRFNVHHGM